MARGNMLEMPYMWIDGGTKREREREREIQGERGNPSLIRTREREIICRVSRGCRYLV